MRAVNLRVSARRERRVAPRSPAQCAASAYPSVSSSLCAICAIGGVFPRPSRLTGARFLPDMAESAFRPSSIVR